MAVPKKKKSKAKRDSRRTHKKLAPVATVPCSQCGEPVLPHRVCMNCGHYGGREVVVVED